MAKPLGVSAIIAVGLLVACSPDRSLLPTPLPAIVEALRRECGGWRGIFDFAAENLERMWSKSDVVARLRVLRVESGSMDAVVLRSYKGPDSGEVRLSTELNICLQPGVEYIAFLRRSETGLYSWPAGPQGIFRVDGDRIHAGTELDHWIGIESFDDMKVADFERHLQDTAAIGLN